MTALRILYVAPWVLGDSGANAADIFPRLGVAHPDIEKVIVADFPKNKFHIQQRQGAGYLRLEWKQSLLRYAARIARKAKQEDIDIIHIFYRQQNALLLIFIRIFLVLMNANAQILMDHRSVNLAKGWRRHRKLCVNFLMQLFCHRLAGNPWAVETNHPWVFRKSHIIDLGYDQLPDVQFLAKPSSQSPVNVWFIGSLKPKNRKSDFLFEMFDQLTCAQMQSKKKSQRQIRFHVAGPTTKAQEKRLRANSCVTYHGVMPRSKLYKTLAKNPGIGIAYMNEEFHGYAPSLKFAEYAIMRYPILASNTRGLQTQAERMRLHRVTFVEENVGAWVRQLQESVQKYDGPEPEWSDAETWSYPSIYDRQVLRLYKEMRATRRKVAHSSNQLKTKSQHLENS